MALLLRLRFLPETVKIIIWNHYISVWHRERNHSLFFAHRFHFKWVLKEFLEFAQPPKILSFYYPHNPECDGHHLKTDLKLKRLTKKEDVDSYMRIRRELRMEDKGYDKQRHKWRKCVKRDLLQRMIRMEQRDFE